MTKTETDKLNLITPDQREKLRKLGTQLEVAEKRIALLKELGLGVTDLEDKLRWAKRRRDILLNKG